MNYSELKNYINSNKIDHVLQKITCLDDVANEKNRYLSLLDEAFNMYGDGDYHFISSPGRSEIGGNHTDHQHGHVVACGLNIDNVVVFKANNTNIVNYFDKSFRKLEVNLDNLEVNESEFNHSESLIKGIASRLKQLGYKYGGFDAVCDSHVLAGSGISSSACFEIMIVEIYNALFNEEKVSPVDRAIIGQYAENVYFGKPSGLMDQMAISVGSFITIDFKNPSKPIIDNYDFSFSDYDYELVLLDTKGDHKNLSNEYAAIPNEMKAVGKLLDVDYLADSSFDKLIDNLSNIRKDVSNDRAVLRALHFYSEDKRAMEEKEAIKNKDIDLLLKLMNESGKSSYQYLQNVYPASRPSSQSLAIALFLSEYVLQGNGACRVHGGGFDGTIQAIVPKNKIEQYKNTMTQVFGEDSLLFVKIRSVGTCLVI